MLDEFFENITGIPGVDIKIAEKLRELHKTGKLTNTNISNAIAKLRETNATNKN